MDRQRDALGRYVGTVNVRNNPEYLRAYRKLFNAQPKQKERRLTYQRQNMRTTFTYLKPGTCPRCGKHGYFYLNQKRNIKTNRTILHPSLEVRHYYMNPETHRNCYDGYCYIETVKAV